MRSSSSFGSISKRSNYSRGFELPEDATASDDCAVGGAMLPIFLNDLRQNNQQDLVEVTLELDDDPVVVCSVTPTSKPGGGEENADPGGFIQRSLSITSRIRRKFPWLRSPSLRREYFDDDERTVPPRMDFRRTKKMLDRTTSSAQRALAGLWFISQTTGTSDENEVWRKVELRFQRLAKDGYLCREDFGECIGMVDSKEFALGIFDALARRRRQKLNKNTKDELHDFWLQISDKSFDARLQIFFDMVEALLLMQTQMQKLNHLE